MESLGNDLKEARKKRDVSLEVVAEQTRISLKHLHCLEEARYAELPGGMYNRAFIRAYCEYLRLDEKPYLERYEAETVSLHEKPAKVPTYPTPRISQPEKQPLVIWTILLAITMTGIFFSRGWLVSIFSPYFSRPPAASMVPASRPETRSTNPVKPDESGPAPQSGQLAEAKSAAQAVTPPSSLPNSADNKALQNGILMPQTLPVQKPARDENANAAATEQAVKAANINAPKKIHLQIRATQECWISVKSDGTQVFVKVLRPGEIFKFAAAEQIGLIIGNAAGVNLTINGQETKHLGDAGEVVKLSIDEGSIPGLLLQ
jgi:cytoskeleton protein RodZ